MLNYFITIIFNHAHKFTQQQQVHSILKKENGPPVSIPVAASGTLPSGTLAPGTLPPGSVSASPSGGPTGAHPGPTSVMSEEMVSLLASNPHLAQALSSISIPVSRKFLLLSRLPIISSSTFCELLTKNT